MQVHKLNVLLSYIKFWLSLKGSDDENIFLNLTSACSFISSLMHDKSKKPEPSVQKSKIGHLVTKSYPILWIMNYQNDKLLRSSSHLLKMSNSSDWCSSRKIRVQLCEKMEADFIKIDIGNTSGRPKTFKSDSRIVHIIPRSSA